MSLATNLVRLVVEGFLLPVIGCLGLVSLFIYIGLLPGINLFAFVLVLFGICSSFAENHAAVFGQVGNFASVIVLHHRTVDYKLSFCQVVGNKDKNEEKNTTQM